MQALDDDRVVLVQAAAHNAQAFDLRPQFNGAIDRCVVGVHHQHELLAQVRAHRFVRDQHRRIGATAHQFQAGIKAGGVFALAVIEHRATTDGAGLGVDLVVDEVHLA
ncbi:hypothetical protein D3C71_1893130 [compost metagenome]